MITGQLFFVNLGMTYSVLLSVLELSQNIIILDTITMFVHTWIMNFEYIFKIYNFFAVAKRYPCYFTNISGVAKIPLDTP
jgi:hypothetical protein